MELENFRNLRERCSVRRDIIREFLAELLGTFVLILFGCGSVAQTILSREKHGENLTIHFGFTLGVMLAVYMAGGVSGAFANFADGKQIVVGENATAGIFASYPRENLSLLNGFIDQVIGTGALVLCILAIVDKKNIGAPKGMEPLVIGLSILAIGVSMALNCGYPINPARDLGPRLFTAMAGWGLEVFRAGNGWWWVPVVGPMVGGVAGAVIYFLMIELHHPELEKNLEDDNSIKDKYELNTVN
ncbi:aquaporin-9-like [Sinocyclocheilus rhinocerous]|uniref:aquaporin-9-like n=1 Tax=Sinocyclocheilus rhinocerous TaxID=307959 RepID=UPI0007B91F54|nr:PREDICTED: aquaporin-9-like [Sinocyclocheilus rhinocerous]